MRLFAVHRNGVLLRWEGNVGKHYFSDKMSAKKVRDAYNQHDLKNGYRVTFGPDHWRNTDES